MIENSLEGLVHYIKATNIKSKIKHPLFLAMYFSNVVRIYTEDVEKLFDPITNLEIQISVEDEDAQNLL